MSLLYLCFETRNLSCGMQKKANYFQKKKEKKNPKYFWCHYSTLSVVEEFKVRTADFPSCYENSTEKKRNEEDFWIQSLKRVYVC